MGGSYDHQISNLVTIITIQTHHRQKKCKIDEDNNLHKNLHKYSIREKKHMYKKIV